MDFYKLTIKEIKRETKNAVSIVFNIPQELKSAYQFIAGQYVTLKLTLDGTELRRAYSICSSPKSGEMRIAVKELKSGTFSKFANTKLAVGDLLEVSIPEGKFTFEPKQDHQKSYVAFAAGSGITPVMSIAKSMLEEEPNSTFVLIYGNKDESETIFHDELHALQLKNLGRFFVHFAYSQANVAGELFGRIDKSIVNAIIKTKHGDKTFSKFYLCGPEAMIQVVTATLKENNVAEKDINFELFGTSSVSEKKVDAVNDGHTNISITVDTDEVTFEMSQKQTILEAALKQGLDVPYSCQGGICSSCICRVTEGSATMKKNQILTDNEVAEGLVLACQAVPTSSEIKVDFDNI
jgi:ring-1,2-phenylacetyl-CoA epoxidase subunit PaaE